MKLPDAIAESLSLRLAVRVSAVVAAVALVVIGAWAWHRSQESRGEAALAAATTLVRQASAPEAPPDARARAIAAIEAVVREQPRFSGLPQAAYQLGNLRYAAGQFAAARGAYELALAKGAAGSLKALCALGIGYTWEVEKNYANAATAYEAALAAMAAKDFLYEDALLSLGRAQELGGQPAAAVATYQRFLTDVPDTRRAEDLRMRVANLKSRPAGQ
jgi:tetratricopeptide (TPR) repeat protein